MREGGIERLENHQICRGRRLGFGTPNLTNNEVNLLRDIQNCRSLRFEIEGIDQGIKSANVEMMAGELSFVWP